MSNEVEKFFNDPVKYIVNPGLALASDTLELGGDLIQEGLMSLLGIDDMLDDLAAQTEGTLLNKTGSVQPMPIIYGTRATGGVMCYMSSTGADNEHLWVVYSLADATTPIMDTLYVHIDDVLTYQTGTIVPGSKFENHVIAEFATGDHTTQPFPLLQAADPNWTSDHLMLGTAAVAVRYTWDKDVFSGLPNALFTVRGCKVLNVHLLPAEVYTFSSNPADLIFDYLTNPIYGKGLSKVDGVDLDLASFDSARTYYNQMVTSYSGGPSHSRMSTNCILNTGQTIMDNLEVLLQSSMSTLPYIDGKFYLIPEKHYTPSDYGLTDYFEFNTDNVIGAWSFKSADVNSVYNRVKVTFPNEDLGYKNDIVYVESSAFRTKDTRLLEKSIALTGTTNIYRALDIGSVVLRRSRNQFLVNFLATPEALQVRAGTIVKVTHPTPGWSGKLFRVTKLNLLQNTNVSVTLVEHESTAYDLSVPNEVATSPDTNLPDPYNVPDITGLTLVSDESVLDIANDGTLITRIKASWNVAANVYVNGYDVEYKKSADSMWLAAGSPNSLNTVEQYIHNVLEGVNYDVRVRARTSADISGAWSTISAHTVIGKTSNPADVTGFTSTITSSGVELSWNANTDLDISGYEIRVGGTSWGVGDSQVEENLDATKKFIGAISAGSTTYRIKAIDTGGRKSTNEVTTAATIVAPSAPVVTTSIVDSNIIISWQAPVSGSLPVDSYEVRVGDTYAISTLVAHNDGTTLTVAGGAADSYTYWVTAIDTAGNYGGNGSSTTTISNPSSPVVSSSIEGQNVRIKWNAPSASLTIVSYLISYDHPINGSTTLGTIDTTEIVHKVDWVGSATFFVNAIDAAGNSGTAGTENVVIAAPSASPITTQVIDNNVLLRWTAPSLGTLPVDSYEIRKGAAYASSTFIAYQKGTFAAMFESSSGDYTYWITAIDTAGNAGSNSSITAKVAQPPDYVLQSDQTDDFSGTRAFATLTENNTLIMPLYDGFTWQNHFSSNGFTTINSQVSAGYPYYAQPVKGYNATVTAVASKVLTVSNITGLASGYKIRVSGLPNELEDGIFTVVSAPDSTHVEVSEAISDGAGLSAVAKAGGKYEQTFDYGQVLNSLSILVNLTWNTMAGDPQVFFRIGVSDDNITYTYYATNSNNVFADSFRYVKIIVEAEADSKDDVLELTNLNVVISVKEITDSGTVTISSTGGTTVTFNKDFKDIASIVVSANSSVEMKPVYDFVDIPSPTSFSVRLFNSSGVEQSSGTISWIARGY